MGSPSEHDINCNEEYYETISITYVAHASDNGFCFCESVL